MASIAPDPHPSAEQLQAYHDGALSGADEGAVRGHLDGCAHCRSEVEGWAQLFEGLGALPRLAPPPGFQHRVLAAVSDDARARPPAVAVDGAVGQHLDVGVLQDHLDGLLAAAASTRVEAHLDRCAPCRDELAAFRGVALALDGLGHLAPSADFAEQVLARRRVEELARLVATPTTRTGRLVARLRRRLPASRPGWAVLGGLATAPALVTALAIRALFTTPRFTVDSLAAALRLWASDTAATLLVWGDRLLTATDLNPWIAAAAERLSSAPVAAAAASLISGSTLAALWVIYRYMIASQPVNRPHAPSR